MRSRNNIDKYFRGSMERQGGNGSDVLGGSWVSGDVDGLFPRRGTK